MAADIQVLGFWKSELFLVADLDAISEYQHVEQIQR
jgi:hypothetical protein